MMNPGHSARVFRFSFCVLVVLATTVAIRADDGDDVVVERTRFAGMLKEWTVKRLFTHPDGMKELRPISSNKSHKSYRIYPDHEADNGEEIAIIGIVDSITRKHRRRVDG